MHIPNRYYLIVDLEATCSEDGTVPRDEMEIIEIGAVMLDAQNFEVAAEYQSFVRPVRHPQLTAFCTGLTGIQQSDVTDAPSFHDALEAMKEWMYSYEDALFCSWGDYDRKQFWQDCRYHEVGFPFQSGHMNLKEEFANARGQRKKLGVGQALRDLGLEFEGSPHRGLDDSRNIARLVRSVCTGA